MTWKKKKAVASEKAERQVETYSYRRGKIEGLISVCALLEGHDAARRIVRGLLKVLEDDEANNG